MISPFLFTRRTAIHGVEKLCFRRGLEVQLPAVWDGGVMNYGHGDGKFDEAKLRDSDVRRSRCLCVLSRENCIKTLRDTRNHALSSRKLCVETQSDPKSVAKGAMSICEA